MTYSLEAAAELLYRTTGITELPENCDGLAACLNAAVEAERASLAAAKLRLPPGEAAFMASVAREFDDEFPIKAGVSVSFDFNDTRQARGIEKKGLATVAMARPGAGGEITLTELGAAWLRANRAAAVPAN